MNCSQTRFLLLLAAIGLGACGDDETTDDAGDPDTSDSSPTDGTTAATGATDDGMSTTSSMDSADTASEDGPPLTTGMGLQCTDQLILDLGLVDGSVSAGDVTNNADGAGWACSVDATAGGIVEAPNNPWLYLRFTAEGLQKVDLDDLEALESTEWDIAAKRFGIRLNSGVSGPSTVSAAAIIGSSYEDVTGLDGASLGEEAFYTEDCGLVDDGNGLGSPYYRLTPWWEYPGCVATTDTPFVIELADGSQLKFVVDAYYQSGQDTCNDTGSMGMGSANFSWRWAFL